MPTPFTDRPDVSEDFTRYAQLVPEFQEPMSKRADAEIKALTHDREARLSEKEVARNIEVFRVSIRTKIAQLDGNAYWGEKLHAVRDGGRDVLVGSTDNEFSGSPRTDLKTFQEKWVKPTERVAVQRGEQEGGRVSSTDMIIDPELITETDLKNLGLEEFIAPKPADGQPRKPTAEHLKVAQRALAIPAIKEMWKGLTPLTLSHEQPFSNLRYFRLFRLNGGKNDGKVLGTQVIGDQKVFFMTDLHSSHRRIDHIHEGYSEEIATLQEIRNVVHDVDMRLNPEGWKQTKDPAKLKEVKAQLMGLVDRLKFVTNDHKKKMREQIDAAATLETMYTLPEKRRRKGDGFEIVRPEKTIIQLNPGAARAGINTSHLHVGRRMQEIADIKGYLAEDQTRIKAHLEDQTKPFTGFYKTVQELHEEFKIYKLGRPLEEREREKIIANLRSIKAKGAFATSPIMLFEPYQSFAHEFVEYLDRTIEALEKGRRPSEGGKTTEAREAVATEFTRAYLVTKIQRFYTELEALYAKFLGGEKIPNFDGLMERIEEMDIVLSKRNIAPFIKTREFNQVFGKLYHLVNGIKKSAREAKEALVTLTEKPERDATARPFVTAMRERIRKFDFAALMGKFHAEPEEQNGGRGVGDKEKSM